MKVGDFMNVYFWDHSSTCLNDPNDRVPILSIAPGWIHSYGKVNGNVKYVVISHSGPASNLDQPYTIVLESNIDHVVVLEEKK